MSGKPKIPLYHYDNYGTKHKYLGKFESQSEVFKKYFNGKKGNLFHQNPVYRELSDGTFITKEPIGRNGLQRAIKRYEDPCVYTRNDDKEIEIINSIGEVVGCVSNVRVLLELTGGTDGSVRGALNANPDQAKVFGSVTWRYKKEKE